MSAALRCIFLTGTLSTDRIETVTVFTAGSGNPLLFAVGPMNGPSVSSVWSVEWYGGV